MAICISDLKKMLPKVPSFFTLWCTVLWLISIYFKYTLNIIVPNFIMVTAQNLIITCCIVGYYIIYQYGHKLLDKYKSLNLYHIHIMNNISHILPFLIILYFYNFESIKTYDELIQASSTYFNEDTFVDERANFVNKVFFSPNQNAYNKLEKIIIDYL